MCCAVSPTSEADRMIPTATVLCVDDSEKMLIICKAILEARGYRVLTASDGQAGLDALHRYTIDIAVIDNRMPGMTGAELAQRIKIAHREMPVLMFSDSGAEPASANVIDSFLNKKDGPLALCDAVGRLLGRSPGRSQASGNIT